MDRNAHRLRSLSTVKRHAKTWKGALGPRTLRQIETRDLERYVGTRLIDVSPASVNRELALLKAVYNTAIRDRLVVENPVRAIKLFREQHRVRFLTEEEEDRLRKTMAPAAWLLVEFALHTGLRQSEQFGLR